MKKIKGNKGSLTIEAALVLPLFMCGFLAIVILANTVRAQSNIQYALDQTAKEISQYYYVVNKLGLNSQYDQSGCEEADQLIKAISDFQGSVGDAANNISNYEVTPENITGDIQNICSGISNDYQSIKSAGQAIFSQYQTIANNPMGVLTCLSSMAKSGLENVVICRLIAQPMCKIVIPKYITNSGDADQTLKDMGIESGLDGLDFGLSTFAVDGKTINVVAVYKLKPLGFNLFDYTFKIKQTASTAAWGGNKTLKDVQRETVQNIWQQGNSVYGSYFADLIKNSYSNNAVKKGIGIDMYYQGVTSSPVIGVNFEANSFVEIHSMNIYSSSYSTYTDSGEYIFNNTNKSNIKSAIKRYANTVKRNTDRVGNSITMADGSTMHVPERSEQPPRSCYVVMVVPADATSEAKSLLNEIAAEIEADTGVKVIYTYRDNALTTN